MRFGDNIPEWFRLADCGSLRRRSERPNGQFWRFVHSEIGSFTLGVQSLHEV